MSPSFWWIIVVDEKQVPVDTTNEDGWNVLHHAAMGGSLEIFQYLIDEKGIPVDGQDNYGRTALTLSAYYGKLDVVTFLLLEKNASLELTDNDGGAALHKAAQGGNIDITKFLVEHGANVKATNKKGQTPFDVASERGHEDVAQYLKVMTQSD